MRDLIRRIEAATPPGRDRALDALRAFAILGVVLGHWFVTALVVDSGTIRSSSPLRYLPELAPASWVFQTLAVFFLVGGMVAARSHASARARGVTYGSWLAARMARLLRPVAVLLVVWFVVVTVLLAAGTSLATVRTLSKLVMNPLWFLLVFAAMTMATPLLAKLNPLWPIAVVCCADLARFGLGAPAWVYWITLTAWLVPFCLGATWARGGLRSRATAWSLLLGGTAATAALIVWAGYPATMVGVPGAGMSNLSPPTLPSVTFGIAQCGLALLLLDPLRKAMRRPLAWTAVAVINLAAMTVFLWHQSAMIAVTAIAMFGGTAITGLHTLPDTPGWVLARLAWLPVFALALALCWAAFRTYEQKPPGMPRDNVAIPKQREPAPVTTRQLL